MEMTILELKNFIKEMPDNTLVILEISDEERDKIDERKYGIEYGECQTCERKKCLV